VPAAKEEDPDTEITYLKGKYTCHTETNTAAGFKFSTVECDPMDVIQFVPQQSTLLSLECREPSVVKIIPEYPKTAW